MKTVKDLLEVKGSAIWSVGSGDTVYQALTVMAEHGVGAVLVLDGAHLVGILSERDYARNVILKGKASKDTLVREIMTTHVVYVKPEQTIDDCMALMTDKRVRHLPVMLSERILGVLSIGDVVKAIISEKQFEIEQLQTYITKG